MTTPLFSVEEFDQFLQSQMVVKNPETLYEPMNYAAVAGGKRLRAGLVITGYEMVGGKKETVYPLALAIELLHTFSLVHDDIMDNSDMRRGKPSVIKKYGASMAILSGDALLIKAYHYLSKIDITYLPQTLNVFNNAAIKICEGQALDILLENEIVVNKNTYLQMIGKKTAVLLATALSIGGIAAGCSKKIAEILYQIGYNMGLVFQIQDDWLDSFGTQEVGKTLYTDILNCKNNYLYVIACEKLKANKLTEFITLYAQKNGGVEKVDQVKTIYQELKIDDCVSKEIEFYHQQCYENIENLYNINQKALLQLTEIINTMLGRTK